MSNLIRSFDNENEPVIQDPASISGREYSSDIFDDGVEVLAAIQNCSLKGLVGIRYVTQSLPDISLNT